MDDFPYFKEIPLDDDEDARKRGVSMRTWVTSWLPCGLSSSKHFLLYCSAKANWAKGQKKDEPSTSKGNRVIVFVAGGVTASEMRAVYEITSRDVYLGKPLLLLLFFFFSPFFFYGLFHLIFPLGSTHIIKPREFIEDLRTISGK